MFWKVGPRSILLAAATVSVLVGVTACSSGANSSSSNSSASGKVPTGDQGGQVTKIVLLSQQTPYTAASYMAKELGYYKKQGLEVSIRAFPSGTTALQTWVSGLGDFVFAGAQPALVNFSQHGKDLRMIQMATRTPKDLVVYAQSDIHSAKDLVGKKVATRIKSTSQWWLEKYLSANGVDPSKVNIINLDSQQMPIALAKGQIAAFGYWQPTGWIAKKDAGDSVHKLADATSVPGVSDLTIYAARPSLIKKQPEVVKSFVKATEQGAKYVKSHMDKTAVFYKSKFGANKKQTLDTLKMFDWNPNFDEPVMKMLSDQVNWSVKNEIIDNYVAPSKAIWTGAVQVSK